VRDKEWKERDSRVGEGELERGKTDCAKKNRRGKSRLRREGERTEVEERKLERAGGK